MSARLLISKLWEIQLLVIRTRFLKKHFYAYKQSAAIVFIEVSFFVNPELT
jgi:hypothetical protein